ncbi:hypothetical protein C8T65DRAFT_96983 [Cerioporus squamosus]|nr:hypothetical protein C8T65DRAFT_96983 [Cerioporus squamosus]
MLDLKVCSQLSLSFCSFTRTTPSSRSIDSERWRVFGRPSKPERHSCSLLIKYSAITMSLPPCINSGIRSSETQLQPVKTVLRANRHSQPIASPHSCSHADIVAAYNRCTQWAVGF